MNFYVQNAILNFKRCVAIAKKLKRGISERLEVKERVEREREAEPHFLKIPPSQKHF